jgi:hypothetical protein
VLACTAMANPYEATLRLELQEAPPTRSEQELTEVIRAGLGRGTSQTSTTDSSRLRPSRRSAIPNLHKLLAHALAPDRRKQALRRAYAPRS